MVLGLLAVLLILMAGLYTLSQRARDSELSEESRLALLLGTQEIHANTMQALLTGKPSSVVNLREDFDYKLPKSKLHLSTVWSPEASLNNPVPSGWGTYDNLFGDPTKPPQLAFAANTSQQAGDTTVSAGHTLLHLKSSASNDGGGSLSSYSHLFPYGIYAPGGKVVARSVKGFTNPPFDVGDDEGKEGEQKTPSLVSGRPVDVFAGADVKVTNSYPSGRALSVNGPVSIPVEGEGAGAIPISDYPHHGSRAQPLADGLKALGAQVAERSLDKTEFLDDELFTAEHLRQLFNGNVNNLVSFFGVGQACKVPFFPIPGIQDDAPFMIVFYLMVPYPVDFSGVGPGSGEQSEKLSELSQEIKKKQGEVDELKKEISEEEAKQPPDKPDKKKIDKLRENVGDLEDEITNLTAQANKISEELKDQSEDIANQISQSKIPQTASEDAEQPTKGWAYLYVIGKLFNIVRDLLSGVDPFKDIFAPTRVVHLGDSNPDWNWSDGKIDMKANLSVPPGRSLAIDKRDLVVRGDVLLMRGSVLKVDGNLTISRPDGWTDFKGIPVSDSETLGYPMGRLLMEPGSSLVVSGDLKVEGGTYDLGSVVLVCPYGKNRGITQLIIAHGDIDFRHGMVAGVSFGDLIDDLAKDNSALTGFNDDFFRPFFLDLAPQLAKFPYIGPWQWRKSYFAEYCTTFEFIPIAEVIGLGGPWPIPLPFENCLNKVFKWVSIVYSTELNFFTGENLYTMSPFWFFGRGVSPVLLKVRSALVADALGQLQWGKMTLEAFEKEGERFLKEVLPSFAVGVFKNLITEIIKSAVESVIPFKPVTCGDGEGPSEAHEIKEKAEEFLKEVIGEFGKVSVSAFQRVLLRMKDSIYEELDGDEESEKSPLRELPGAAVLAGGQLTVGNANGARLALGLLMAQQDVTIHCKTTVGTVISLEGDVEVEDLYHYPYYDRASLYNPFKFDAGLAGLTESLVDLVTVKGTLAGDVAGTFPRRIAEGWR
jgi:hypothetical protein